MLRGKRKQRYKNGGFWIAIVAAAPIGPALAQELVGASGIEEIVIVAEKRKVDLQKSALSVSALTSDVLEKGAITDATGLNGYVPGLQISNSGGSERVISIRGVGQQTPENFFTQPGVSFHIDSVYIPNSIALNMGFFDVDHIEVARGPQGTVYGQSSTGGAINVLTKQPTIGEFGGELKTTFGTYAYMQGYGALNVPLGDKVAVRGAIQRTAHDGFSKATVSGQELDDADNTHYKLQGVWKPTENWTISLSGTRYVDSHNGAALKAITDPNPDIREVTQDFPARFRLRSDLDILTVAYDFDWGTAKLVSAYEKLKHDQSFEADRLDIATNLLLGNANTYDHVAAWATETETLVNEFTLASAPGKAVDWIVGAFYTQVHSEQYVVEYAGNGTTLPLTPVPPKDSTPAALASGISYEDVSAINRTSWAPFFQTTWHITDRLRATIGARFNDDKFDGFGQSFYGDRNDRAYHKNNWTGTARVEYDVATQNLMYVSFSRGYKPGGVNTGSGGLDTAPTIKSEIVDSYEIGSKNRFLDNHLQVNAAAFYTFYDNMQYIQEDPISYAGGIANIPKSRIWGAELEAIYRAFEDRLEVGGNMTTLNGEITSEYFARDRRLADAAALASGDPTCFGGSAFFPSSCATIRGATAFNVEGNQPPNLPALSFSMYGSWKQKLGTFGDLTSRVEYIYRSAMKSRIFNEADADDVPSYGVWNLFFQYVPPTDPWRISASLTNVFDQDGVTGRFVDPYSSGVVSDEFIPPRQFLVTLGYTF